MTNLSVLPNAEICCLDKIECPYTALVLLEERNGHGVVSLLLYTTLSSQSFSATAESIFRQVPFLTL